MRLDVYPTDAEAFEAAAVLAASILAEANGVRPPSVALSGGRSGRGVLVALAACSVPWARVEWWWADERLVPPTDPRSNVRVARESLLEPRGVADARVHPPPVELGAAERVAAAYAAALAAAVPGEGAPAFDLVLLGMGADGHVASLVPGGAALGAGAPCAAVGADEVREEPRVPRVTITPPVLAAARHVIVVVAGDAKAAALAAALADPVDPARFPAQLVRPSERVRWIVDHGAASVLLRDARPAAET